MPTKCLIGWCSSKGKTAGNELSDLESPHVSSEDDDQDLIDFSDDFEKYGVSDEYLRLQTPNLEVVQVHIDADLKPQSSTSPTQTAHNIHWTSILHPKLIRTSMDCTLLAVLRVKGSFQEAALIIFPSTPIKNTEDGMKRWLRRAKKRVTEHTNRRSIIVNTSTIQETIKKHKKHS
ncbi:hypothetical protein NQ317_013328, partial [Molorchus minor]